MLSVPSIPSGHVSQYALHQGYVDRVDFAVEVNVSGNRVIAGNFIFNQYALENGNVSRIKYAVLVNVAANKLSGDHERLESDLLCTLCVRKELFTISASVVRLNAVLGSGSGYLCNKRELVTGSLDGLGLAGDLFLTRSAVYNLVIRAVHGAGSGYYVLLYRLAGSVNMYQLLDNQISRGDFYGTGSVREELITAGAGVMRLGTVSLLGSGNLGNKGQGMGDDRELNGSTADLCLTLGAVYDLIVGSLIVGDRYILLYRLTGGMSELVDGLLLTRDLFAALGAVYDLVIGAFLGAGSGYYVLLYRLAGSMGMSGRACGQGGIVIAPRAANACGLKISFDRVFLKRRLDIVLGQT